VSNEIFETCFALKESSVLYVKVKIGGFNIQMFHEFHLLGSISLVYNDNNNIIGVVHK